jgi:hypothetical protein
MANEITISVYGNLANGGIKDQQKLGNVSLTQAGKAVHSNTYALTDAFAAIGKGSVGSVGQVFITNVNASGFIEVSVDGGSSSLLKIAAGVTDKISLTPAYTITNIQIKMTTSSATGFAHVRIWEA